MKMLVLGGGHIGPACAYYLLSHPEVKQVTLLDASESQLAQAEIKLRPLWQSRKLELMQFDLTRQEIFTRFINSYDFVLGALPWKITREVIQSVVLSQKPFVSVTRPHYQEASILSQELKDYQQAIILGCGLEPGLTEIAAVHALSHFTQIEELHLRCGGIPEFPTPPLNYKSVFNSNGLPIEARTAFSIENGIRLEVPRFSGVESIEVPPVGTLEAWHDGMLPWLIEIPALQMAKRVTQKTLRWPGFAKLIQSLHELGFLSKKPIIHERQEIIPMEFSNTVLKPHAAWNEMDKDLSILQVEAGGLRGNHHHQWTATLIDRYNDTQNFSAMARTTGFMLGSAAVLIGQGEVEATGWKRPEEIFVGKNYLKLMDALGEFGIKFKCSPRDSAGSI